MFLTASLTQADHHYFLDTKEPVPYFYRSKREYMPSCQAIYLIRNLSLDRC